MGQTEGWSTMRGSLCVELWSLWLPWEHSLHKHPLARKWKHAHSYRERNEVQMERSCGVTRTRCSTGSGSRNRSREGNLQSLVSIRVRKNTETDSGRKQRNGVGRR